MGEGGAREGGDGVHALFFSISRARWKAYRLQFNYEKVKYGKESRAETRRFVSPAGDKLRLVRGKTRAGAIFAIGGRDRVASSCAY